MIILSSTSRLECSPLIMFEAMAAGKIYLGTDVGNCMEIQKNIKTGFISNNPNQIQKKLNILLKKKHIVTKKYHRKFTHILKKIMTGKLFLKNIKN